MAYILSLSTMKAYRNVLRSNIFAEVIMILEAATPARSMGMDISEKRCTCIHMYMGERGTCTCIERLYV